MERNSRSHRRCQTDGAFTINTKLELLGVTGPISRAKSIYKLQPAMKRGSDGVCRSPL